MISRFFKKKSKPQPKPEPPARKAAPKKPIASKPAAKKAPVLKAVDEPVAEAPHFPLPSFKSGKIITAEGWKRLMMRRSSGKK